MRRLPLFTLIFAASLLSSGFTNIFQKSKEPEIKGIVCGTDLYMNVLIENFPKEAIFTYEAEDEIYDEFNNLEGEYFYRYIFDLKTGKLYTPDESSSNALLTVLKPFYQEKFDDNVSYTYKSEIKRNSLKVLTTEYKNRLFVDSWEDDISLKKLNNTFFEEGEKVMHKCTYFPIPGTLMISE